MPCGPLLQAHEVQRVPNIIHQFLLKSASLPVVPMSLMEFFMTQARHLGAIFISFLAYFHCTFDYSLFWGVYSSQVNLYFSSINADGNKGLYLCIDASQNSHTPGQLRSSAQKSHPQQRHFSLSTLPRRIHSLLSLDYHVFYSNLTKLCGNFSFAGLTLLLDDGIFEG